MIAKTQSQLLAALLNQDYAKTDLRVASGVYGSTFTHAYQKLLDAGLIDQERLVHGSKTMTASITTDGRVALAAYRRDENRTSGVTVDSTTINKLAGIYRPPVWMTRNNGHTHIASNGVRC